jgi:hypothetical protein
MRSAHSLIRKSIGGGLTFVTQQPHHDRQEQLDEHADDSRSARIFGPIPASHEPFPHGRHRDYH